MPQMIAAPTFQLPQLQAFSGGAQTTEAAANLANQLLQAYMKKLELDKGDARSAELRDLLVSASQQFMENPANITPEALEGLAVGADLTQIPEEQRLSTGAVPVEQALGFRVEQGQTSDPLAEALLRPRLDPAQPYQIGPDIMPDLSTDPRETGTGLNFPANVSTVVQQYGEAPTMPPEIAAPPRTTEQIQKDLRVIPEIDTAALPQFYTTAEGEKISVDDPNIDRPYIARDIPPKQAFIEALQGTDTRFRKSDFGPLEQVLFEDMMKAAPGQTRILSGKDLPAGIAKGTVLQEFTNADGQLDYKVLQAAPKPTKEFSQISTENLQRRFPDRFSKKWVEENANKMWNYNKLDKKITQIGGSRQTINVGKGDQPFYAKFEGDVAVDAAEAMDEARQAGAGAEVLDTMLAFFDDPDFGTGKMESMFLPLRAYGYSLGFAVDENDIGSAEAFNAKAQQLVLAQVEFMKGALSNKELDFLAAQVASLDKTPAGNKLILWLGKSTANKAAVFSRYMRSWRDKDTGEPFQKVGSGGWFQMLDDWAETPEHQMTPKQYIMGLAEQDEDLWRSQNVPDEEIIERLERRYSLSLVGQVFKDY